MTPSGDSPLDVRVTPPVRPAKATATAALLVVAGAAAVPATIALVRLPSFPLVDWAVAVGVILVYTQFVLGPLQVVCGVCLLLRRSWAARTAAVVCAANVALGVGALFGSVFLGLVTVAVNGLALWLLSAADVKYWLSLPRNV